MDMTMNRDFSERIKQLDPKLLNLDRLQTLQVNLGNKCNQRCRHCHIQAGPDGKKIMSREVMLKIISFLKDHHELTVDITGGCPELNPDFKFFLNQVCRFADSVMVRTNLTVFLAPGMQWVQESYSANKVILIASLPCFSAENVEEQRGKGVFEKSIAALRILNNLGYGYQKDLELNLVYNPGGVFIPCSQKELEEEYKKQLKDNFGIKFNKLFTITNAPVGRFRQYLKANGQLENYQKLLIENFNTAAARNIMCRNLISVDYKGRLYNCDFNQALGLNLEDKNRTPITINDLDKLISQKIEIITANHCFCCTAGAGSSCTGSLVE